MAQAGQAKRLRAGFWHVGKTMEIPKRERGG